MAKEESKKQIPKEISTADYTRIVVKHSNKLMLCLVICLAVIVIQASFILWIKQPKMYQQRLYEDITNNETADLSELAMQKKVKEDLYHFVLYIVSHLDLKSKNAIVNYKRLFDLSSGNLKKKLQAKQDQILVNQKRSDIDRVFNEITNISHKLKRAEKQLIVTVEYVSVEFIKNKKPSKTTKTVDLALKIVDRWDFVESQHQGGWYFGLTFDDIKQDILSI